jgi:hypothetical protein
MSSAPKTTVKPPRRRQWGYRKEAKQARQVSEYVGARCGLASAGFVISRSRDTLRGLLRVFGGNFFCEGGDARSRGAR